MEPETRILFGLWFGVILFALAVVYTTVEEPQECFGRDAFVEACEVGIDR